MGGVFAFSCCVSVCASTCLSMYVSKMQARLGCPLVKTCVRLRVSCVLEGGPRISITRNVSLDTGARMGFLLHDIAAIGMV